MNSNRSNAEPVQEEVSNKDANDNIKDISKDDLAPKIQSSTKSIADIMKDKEQSNDGSDDENLEEADPNTIFEFHGNKKQFSPRSLYIFKYDNCIRLKFVSFIMHPNFDNTVIGLIILNSLLLGCINYE